MKNVQDPFTKTIIDTFTELLTKPDEASDLFDKIMEDIFTKEEKHETPQKEETQKKICLNTES